MTMPTPLKELKMGDVFLFDAGLCPAQFAYLGQNGTEYNALNLSSCKPVNLPLLFTDVEIIGRLKVDLKK
jgi:hypothetical protein